MRANRRNVTVFRRLGVVRRSLPAASVAAVAAAAVLTQPAAAAGRIILGANGAREQLSRQVGVPLASHVYGILEGPVLDARLINVQAMMKWRAVANATPGSRVHGYIVMWARAIKSNGHHTFLTFNHEPNVRGAAGRGTSADFIAAWRRFVDIFRQERVTNVNWVWNVTAISFKLPGSDFRAAAHWYPGDTYVDSVGADGFNWYGCGPQARTGGRNWRDLARIASDALQFARAHRKPLLLPEFGSAPDPQNPNRKAQWISTAHAWLAANAASITGAWYHNRLGEKDCSMMIRTEQELAAFRAMARDPLFTN